MKTSFEDIRDTLSLMDDWEDRYRFIIDLGKELEPLADEARIEANKVRGCASQVWLVPEWRDGPNGAVFAYGGDSDAHIVRGLVAVVFALYAGKTREDILKTDAKAAFNELGLAQHLTAQRANGLFSMIERIRSDAKADVAA